MKSDTKVIRLSGDIDHHSSERLRQDIDRLIEAERPRCVILDLSAVSVMDSSGLGLVLGRYKRIKRYGGRMCVRGVGKSVDRVFTMSGIYRIIEKI